MKYQIFVVLLLSGGVCAKTIKDCRTQYVWCRAEAHCAPTGFYTRLRECSKEYAHCKKDVKEHGLCACQGREWRNSYYFLG